MQIIHKFTLRLIGKETFFKSTLKRIMAVANSLKRAEHQSVVPKDLARCKQSLEGLFTTVLRKCWSIPLFNLEGSVVGLLVTFRNLEGPNTTEDHGQQQHRKTHRQLSKPLLTTLPLRREYLPAQLKYRGTLQTSQAENGVYTELEAIDVLRGEGLSSSKGKSTLHCDCLPVRITMNRYSCYATLSYRSSNIFPLHA